MAGKKRVDRIDDLFRREEWEKARRLLETERGKDPENHWLLTQLGVTFYEQLRYREALPLFLSSRQIVADCPLTLWNLAGTLDALGEPAKAIPIYAWLLQSKVSPEEDPCWESEQWTESLKADCVYRLGVCFQHLAKRETAEHCFRQYIDLLLIGIDGSYSLEDAVNQVRHLWNGAEHGTVKRALRKVVDSTLRSSGIQPAKGSRNHSLKVDVEGLLAGYGQMAKNEARESEALAWAEGTVGDLADKTC